MRALAYSVAVAALMVSVASPAAAQSRDFQIPTGDLQAALSAFIRQSGAQIIFRIEDVRAAQSRGVAGRMPVDAALAELLAGTGLVAQRETSGAIAIVPAPLRREPAALRTQAPAAPLRSDVGATPAGPNQLEDIVVTARRTAESQQSVPVAVTALSGALIDRLNLQDTAGVAQFTPNLSIALQPSSLTAASIYIRGIGNNEPSALAEQGVGVYLDGVYVARTAGAIFDLVDVERIEVLRGPQGTLFGRNSVGGAIQIVSRAPADAPGAELKGGYGRYNDWYARGRIDTGLIGGTPLKASISFKHREAGGYFDNLLTSDANDPGSVHNNAVTAALHGDFDALTADYSFDYDRRRGASMFSQIVAATPDVRNYFGQSASLGGAPFQISPLPLSQGRQEGYTDLSGRLRYASRSRVQGHSLRLALEVAPEITVKSITSYRKFYQDTIIGLSGNGGLRGVVLDPVTFAPSIGDVTLYNGSNAPQRQHQVSQELQLLGKAGDFSYTAGGYYFYEKSSEQARQALTFVLQGGQAGLNLAPIQADGGSIRSTALFGQLGWKPGQGPFELTGGLRYTRDHKQMTLSGDVKPNLSGTANFSNLSWLVSANYALTTDLMAYARVSTGFRSGGINPRVAFINVFRPEKALSNEAGIKADWFDRRLRTNLAAFYTDYKNLQIQQFQTGTGGVTSFVTNAGKVNYKGIELETTALLGPFTVTGALGYTDPTYRSFLFRDPVTNQLLNVAKEARLVQTAKFNAHASVQHSFDLGFADLTTRVDYSYRSTVYYHSLDRVNPLNPQVRSRPDHNLAARIDLGGMDTGSGSLDVGAWVDNLTNERTISFGVDFGSLGFGTAAFRRPRTAGIDAKLTF